MPLLTSLLVLMVSARLLGQLFARYRQPAIVGEMLAGVLLGPAVFNLVKATPALLGITDLAVFLVVLSAGLEMNFKDIMRAMSGKGLVIAALGFLLPLGAGVAVGLGFQLDAMRTLFLGLCVSITALPVAVRILESFGRLDSDIARYAIAAAIINDVAALLVLGVILGWPETGTPADVTHSLLLTSGKMLLFFALVGSFNQLLTRLERKGVGVHRVPERLIAVFGEEALFGMVALFVLAFASVSEMLGLHFVIGAFFGALLLNKELFLASHYADLEKTLNSVTGGFLAPLFFASLGLQFNLMKMHSAAFVVTVLAVSIASKMLAGWLGARWIGLPQVDALGIGFILNARGVMELVIASIAFQHGFIGEGLFSTLVLMGVVTTMITPVLFRRFVQPHRLSASGVGTDVAI